MNKSRIAAVVVVVVLVAAAGILGLRSWVGIEAGEDLASGPSSPAPSTSSATAGDEDEDSPTPSPTPSPSASEDGDEDEEGPNDEERESPRDRSRADSESRAQLTSPSGIASDIKRRLDRSGPATTVSCPQAVSSAVGTSFTCSVAYADAPQRTVADAQVNIVGSGLRYVWRSVPR